MVKGKTPATTDLATIREQTASVLDVFQRVEDSCSQAQEWIRDVVEAIDIGHQMLHPPESGAPTTSLRMPKSNFEYLRPSSTESATGPTELESNGLPPNKSSPNNSQLRVHCLGKFCVYRGNRPIEGWRNNKAKGVFKLLLLNLGKPLPKDIFMEALWQNTSVQSATNSFRVAVHELRQRLAFTSADGRNLDYIITDGSNYSINPEADIWLDFKEFESRWKGSRILEKTGRANEAIAAYRKAESLYQGDLLEEDIYEDWTLLKREFLLDIYLAMLGKISAYHLKTGDYDACIESSQKLLAKDRCREDAYQYIIKCYSNMGFRSQALRWYALCEGTLRRELDCPVSPETRALAHSLSGGGNILGETVLILR